MLYNLQGCSIATIFCEVAVFDYDLPQDSIVVLAGTSIVECYVQGTPSFSNRIVMENWVSHCEDWVGGKSKGHSMLVANINMGPKPYSTTLFTPTIHNMTVVNDYTATIALIIYHIQSQISICSWISLSSDVENVDMYRYAAIYKHS